MEACLANSAAAPFQQRSPPWLLPTLQDVSFHYPARPALRVLSGLNLVVRPGEIVALVGPSGGGKSSIVKLVERFYMPDEGTWMVAWLVAVNVLWLIDVELLRSHAAAMPRAYKPSKALPCLLAMPCVSQYSPPFHTPGTMFASGCVLIDDRPVGEYDRKWLKQRVAFVSQVGCSVVGAGLEEGGAHRLPTAPPKPAR